MTRTNLNVVLLAALAACGPSTIDMPPDDPMGDVTAPLVSGVAVRSLTATTAVIGWNTDELAVSHVEYGRTTSYGLHTPLYGLALAHQVMLEGLAPSTLYHFRVESQDAADN